MKDLNDAVRSESAVRAIRAVVSAAILWMWMPGCVLWANEAHWIWSPRHDKYSVPEGACYFRKTFTATAPIRVQATIAADDQYELYINGQRVGAGDSSQELDEYNITDQVKAGQNTIAVKVTNRHGATAALAMRVFVREREGGWETHSSDETWLTDLHPATTWSRAGFDDHAWEPAQVFGPFGTTAPWDREEDVARDEAPRAERFHVARGFEVERVVDGETTGPLLAMAFNEFGHVILSREGDGLLLVVDTDDDQIVDDVRVYCDQVQNVQGILPLNGDVYVTGTGPQGNGLYCLSDQDRDGQLESVRLLFNFEGEVGEQTAHGIVLGPDGWIYVVLGVYTSPLKAYDAGSPHRNYYEGDLVRPRYEDPRGYGVGRKVPGGVILRTDLDGDVVQLVAGGLRNVHDLAFNRDGELFIHDSDTESDIGTTWYRPTRLCHILPGGEYGWRSGWANWPEYYVDVLPSIADTGRSSPTGAVFYDHAKFPDAYRDALFLGDRSEGRILVARLRPDGASYSAEVETFLSGRPLNVTDLEVGPDGWLYFITGGRGTGGGLYRVIWTGDGADDPVALGTGIAPAIRQPQLQSAWGRQAVAKVQQQLGSDWGPMLLGVARSTANPTAYRTRALDLMQLFGPTPEIGLLLELSHDKNELVRAKAAEFMGLYGNAETRERLLDLLEDSDHRVRRKALEAIVRAGQQAPAGTVIPLLASDDRCEAWAARRVLEWSPVEQWRDAVLESEQPRIFIQGALALMIAQPSAEDAFAVLERSSQFLADFLSDRDFVDMLRLMQVAMLQGDVAPEEMQTLGAQLAEEFPADNLIMNRELIRLLVYLQEGSIMDRYFEYLDSDVPGPDRMHVAMHLRFLTAGWTLERKEAWFEFVTQAKSWDGGSGYPLYLGAAARDFARQLSEEESVEILQQGAQWPDAALGALYKLPRDLDDDLREALIRLDETIDQRKDSASWQLMVGIVAVLARSGDDASMAYLRTVWDRNPERREPVAMGLAQAPGGENWPYLVQSLPVLEGVTAREVLQQLATVDQVPDDPEQIRQVILCGLRLGEEGADDAELLLEHWTGEELDARSDRWQDRLAAWQRWFVETYPDLPAAELPVDTAANKWKYEELLEFVTGREGQRGDPALGALVFEKADCAKCHRFGDRGEVMGPDLTTLAKRLTRKEILQSILYPSHMISREYISHNIRLTDDRQIHGIVAPGAAGEKIVLNTDGEKVLIAEADIDQITPSKLSSMPDGALKDLSRQEIADLFVYFTTGPTQTVALQPPEIDRPKKSNEDVLFR